MKHLWWFHVYVMILFITLFSTFNGKLLFNFNVELIDLETIKFKSFYKFSTKHINKGVRCYTRVVRKVRYILNKKKFFNRCWVISHSKLFLYMVESWFKHLSLWNQEKILNLNCVFKTKLSMSVYWLYSYWKTARVLYCNLKSLFTRTNTPEKLKSVRPFISHNNLRNLICVVFICKILLSTISMHLVSCYVWY